MTCVFKVRLLLRDVEVPRQRPGKKGSSPTLVWVTVSHRRRGVLCSLVLKMILNI